MHEIEFPHKLAPLFEPKRYKIIYGGRGGAKSWSIARALLIMGLQRPLRILCGREFQNSIQDSVHRLLSDQIADLELDRFYEVQQKTIRGANGSEFLFEGLRHNFSKIKSYEGIDVCWVEEGQTVSKTSWDTLIPTIRKDGSEIWCSFNPGMEGEETYRRFITDPPPDSWVCKVNWSDNPWFPATLQKEMEDLRNRDRDAWLNVWEGHCRVALEGAIYTDELRTATEEDRITEVRYDERYPVHTFWDLGHSSGNATSIWFMQRIHMRYNFIDHLHGEQQKITHFIGLIDKKRYNIGRHYMPHDAENQHMQDSIAAIMRRHYPSKVFVVPRTNSVTNDINAVRMVFPNCYFDEDRCAGGLKALRHYRYEVHPDTGVKSNRPLHDWASNGADAFRTFAVGFRSDQERAPRKVHTTQQQTSTSWMGA